MYKIIYKNKSENKIKSFIQSYKNIFIETFTDTGLFYEDLIRENYINNSKKIYSEIIDNIDKSFIEKSLLGYSILKNNNLQKIMLVGNYRLFVEYSEDIKSKIRFIEDIKFSKK